jgi:hypothetical protein
VTPLPVGPVDEQQAAEDPPQRGRDRIGVRRPGVERGQVGMVPPGDDVGHEPGAAHRVDG